MAVRDIDRGWKRIKAEVAKLQRAKIKVGFSGDVSGEIAQRAAWQEFGTINIPPRPFMRTAIDENQPAIERQQRGMVADVLDGKKTAKQALEDYAAFIVHLIDIQISKSRSWATPLDPATVEKKGHSQPLVDSGEMQDALTFRIEGI